MLHFSLWIFLQAIALVLGYSLPPPPDLKKNSTSSTSSRRSIRTRFKTHGRPGVPADSEEHTAAVYLDLDRRDAWNEAPDCAVPGANVGGKCLDANTNCCNGYFTVGFCVGPTNIQCCTEVQQCRSGSGTGFCNDVSHVSCSVSYVQGLCPGGNNIQCCMGASGATQCSTGN
ncbi:hypothetical protein K435DRAFT_840052 [Dendrothele bispora CBS 962.96]|uniref:Hydrophobin n=1 Tax=Dendrothele bispora (strain CBS 962.96) TaxID=1314807 RepID=A0A4S8LXL0_DENBC|nr:hypothetical protein K435DRAFT_971695 [Dendrothele bispora CBS 962.96]THU93943.1 hypothetical protein K435DRAFT_840052 [Dendrothele bispora CBS 962.96]